MARFWPLDDPANLPGHGRPYARTVHQDDAIEPLWSSEPEEPPRAAVEAVYGAALTFPVERPHLVANFVETADGVAVFGERGGNDAATVSLGSAQDRHVMALLRSLADAVVIGSGTFRVARTHQWSPGGLVPDRAAAFDELRAQVRGTRERATLVVVTGSGDIPVGHPALTEPEAPAIVVTTDAGAIRLRGRLPGGVTLVSAAPDGPVPAERLVELVAERCGGLILSEGGPELFGSLLRAQLAGRERDLRRRGVVEGFAAAPDEAPRLALRSLRRAGDHLFLRYAIGREASPARPR
jgi:riboflavin biosynthesis pyrimidine reductase